MQNKVKAFKWKHYEAEIILWSVRWYTQFPISYRDLVIMAKERGLAVAHTTMMRWVRIPVRMNTDSGMKLNTDSDFT